MFSLLISTAVLAVFVGGKLSNAANGIPDNPEILRRACPDYVSYASIPQLVLSEKQSEVLGGSIWLLRSSPMLTAVDLQWTVQWRTVESLLPASCGSMQDIHLTGCRTGH